MAHKIEWTEQTWNPSAGCTKISSGCQNCYAETMAIRLQAMGVEGYENGFKFNLVPSRLNDPYKRKKPTVLFLSVEPLLEDLGSINLTNIDWVIVGGESGNRARPMDKEWVLNIKTQCEKNDVAFFFKQWGTWGADKVKRNKKLNGKEIDGKIWQQFPEVIEQQFAVV